jgi:stearoyl-CoA desaturase (delta-9 desaturase)
MELVLWLTTGIKRQEWVAVHLCHHAHADIPGDPHSPVLLGLWKVQLGNLFLYAKAAKDPKVIEYGKHVKLSWAERNIFCHTMYGFLVTIAVVWAIFGFWPMAIIMLTHVIFYVFILNSSINGWCHVRGYKNYLKKVVAFNNRLLALLTVGEGLHNNHHSDPGSARLRRSAKTGKFGEIDLGWLLIKALSFFRLAQINRA